MIVTIDGPVASGKSTAAKNLAAALGFRHLDTGAIYRCLALLARERGIDTADAAAVKKMLAKASVRVDGDRVCLDGRDVTREIRLPEISMSVRPLAENGEVRGYVKALEREFARGCDVVAEGRDMGTVVFPEAEVKIYLTASDEERARRRFEELQMRGMPQEYGEVLAALRRRDHADRARRIAPLRKPDGAVEVDSSWWSVDQTAACLERIVRERLGGR